MRFFLEISQFNTSHSIVSHSNSIYCKEIWISFFISIDIKSRDLVSNVTFPSIQNLTFSNNTKLNLTDYRYKLNITQSEIEFRIYTVDTDIANLLILWREFSAK